MSGRVCNCKGMSIVPRLGLRGSWQRGAGCRFLLRVEVGFRKTPRKGTKPRALDYFFFLPTFSPAASKSDKSSSFFCVGIQSGESRRRRAGVESKTPESYLLDLLLRRGLGHGDAGGLGRVGIEALEVGEAFFRLLDELVVLCDLRANQPVSGVAATI